MTVHEPNTLPSLLMVIVAVGDVAEDLSRLAASLEPQTVDRPRCAVLLVDNGLNERARAAAHEFASARLLAPDVNRGYGAAINRAAAEAGGNFDWIIACNADLVFPPGSIAALTEALSAAEERVACLAPLLLDPEPDFSPGRVQPSVGRFPTLWRLLAGRARPRRTRKYRRPPRGGGEVDWATGACLALRRRAFAEVGGFDESLFLDYEDTDLCRRFALRGWRCRLEPRWRVIHTRPNAQRPADPQRQIHTRESLMTYLAKHRPPWEARTMGLFLRAALALRPAHPMAASWRAGLDRYRRLQERCCT